MKSKNTDLLPSQTEVDVIAKLDGRVRIKRMTMGEYRRLPKSKWKIEAFQIGYHGYTATE